MTKVETKRGLVCSECGHETLDVVYTRKRESKIVRLRRCPKCQTRYLTTERMVGTVACRESSKAEK
jgi:transcriptional regulator NrdR family protein